MSTNNSSLYKFDDYLVEEEKGYLWRKDELVPLTPKAFKTLMVLIKHRGKVVEKDFLLDEVWADAFVEEATIAQNIWTLRKTLGTCENGKQFIETIPRRGYRFVGNVKEINEDQDLIIVEHRVRTHITAEHEVFKEETAIIHPETSEQTLTSANPKTFAERFKIHKSYIVLTGIISCLVIGIGILALRHSFQPANFLTTKFRQIEITKLTSSGNIKLTAVSPDGKYLAMVDGVAGEQAIAVRQIDNSTTVNIIPPQYQQIIGLTFSPDSKQIYYTVYKREQDQPVEGKVYKISMLGGIAQQIESDVDSPIAISPDNQQYAFVRNYPKERESAIILTNFNGGHESEKKLATRQITEFFSGDGLAWSPDGKTIASSVNVKDSQSIYHMDVAFVDANTGNQQILKPRDWTFVGQMAWLTDGSGVTFPALNKNLGSQNNEIWTMSYPKGDVYQVTTGMGGTRGLSLTADSNTIVTIKSDSLANFEVTSASDLASSKSILQNLTEYDIVSPDLNWTANDKILYSSTLNGNKDIWIMNADGTGKHQLTSSPGSDYFPVATSDGKYIVFVSNRSNGRNLWIMKADGSEQKQLTTQGGVNSPSIAPDNKTVFYSVTEEPSKQPNLYKISLDNGKAEKLNSFTTYLPKISPDGKYIACYSLRDPNEIRSSKLNLTLISPEDGSFIKQFDNSNKAIVQDWFSISWLNNQSIGYVNFENDETKIWQQPINGEKAQPLPIPKADYIFRFAWSPDGRNLIYERQKSIDDVVLINSK